MVLIEKNLPRYNLRGGKVLGSGNFGSVIFPGIPCRAGEEANHTSKIFLSSAENVTKFRHETSPKLLQILRQIDPHNHRFLYCTSLNEECQEFLVSDLPQETQSDLHKILFNFPENTKEILYFNMPKANKFGGRINQAQTDYLEKSLSMLHEKGIAHCDLHMDNIMCTQGNEDIPKIIDFGEWQEANPQNIRNDLSKLHDLRSKAPQLKKQKRNESEGGGGVAEEGAGEEEESESVTKKLF